jgi:AAA+ ATPase superfamily predicted ATPase
MSSKMKDYFPAKLAIGERFCNRKNEQKMLQSNIKKGRHTVLLSPRRYGKSSLANKVVNEMKLPFVSIDLFLANTDEAITKRIMQGIAKAVSQLLPPTEKLLSIVQKAFRHFKVSLSANYFNIEATFEGGMSNSVDQIFNALEGLVQLAQAKKNRVIFFIDEFQDIADSENSKAIQGAIRHVAQATSDLVFIFSGSNRHLLAELFDDKSMPLYMLCDKIHLDRMSSNDYLPYIQKTARERWKQELDKRAYDVVMQLTELHPFYINMLCNELWNSQSKHPPTHDKVVDAWAHCYDVEERRLIVELERLTSNQQNFMKALAKMPTAEPNSQRFIQMVNMAQSSLHQTINALLEKDMIYKVTLEDEAIPTMRKKQLRILDPLLAYALRKYE